jgi:ABC-type dipeptide/oligopeptide/nickel transport system permease subunit
VGDVTFSKNPRSWWSYLSPGAKFAGMVVVLLTLLASLAPVLAPHDPTLSNMQDTLLPPGQTYYMGTDQLGRDILSRILYGLRPTILAAFFSVVVASACGSLAGTLAGFYGGWLDQVVMRVADIMLAFPSLLLALTIVTISGPGLIGISIAVGVSYTATFIRMVRASILSVRQNEYVTAARAMGCGGPRIMLRHVWPNIGGSFIALCTLTLAWAILATSSLSFLGFGVQPPAPELGSMLSQSRDWIRSGWWLTTFPGATIMVAVLAVSTFGDGLRDALDPTLRM